MVLKQDGSGLPMLPGDFRIGLDVGILGRSIRIYDCDQYTREFFEVREKWKGRGSKTYDYLHHFISNKIMYNRLYIYRLKDYHNLKRNKYLKIISQKLKFPNQRLATPVWKNIWRSLLEVDVWNAKNNSSTMIEEFWDSLLALMISHSSFIIS